MTEENGEIVKLNIGGIKYWTTRATLLNNNDSSEGKSFFHALLAGNFPVLKDSKGYLFIDRNGKLFEPILDYLRSGKWKCPKDMEEAQVLAEARFYGIEPADYQCLTDKSIMEMVTKAEQQHHNLLFEQHRGWLDRITKVISDQFAQCVQKRTNLKVSFMPSLETLKTMIGPRIKEKRIASELQEFTINAHLPKIKNDILHQGFGSGYGTLELYLKTQCGLSVKVIHGCIKINVGMVYIVENAADSKNYITDSVVCDLYTVEWTLQRDTKEQEVSSISSKSRK